MDMGVDTAGREDLTLACDDLGSRSDDDRDRWLDVGVPRLTNRRNPSRLHTDIGLDDTPVVYNQCVRNHEIHAILAPTLGLAHPISDHFPPPKSDLVSGDGRVGLWGNPQVRVT